MINARINASVQRPSPPRPCNDISTRRRRHGHLPLQPEPHRLEPEPEQRPLAMHRFPRLPRRRLGRVAPLPPLDRRRLLGRRLQRQRLHGRETIVRRVRPSAHGHEARLLARGVAPGALPLPLLRRPPLPFLPPLPPPRFLLLRPQLRRLVFQILGRFALVELLALEVDDGFLGRGVDGLGGVRAAPFAEGALERGAGGWGWGHVGWGEGGVGGVAVVEAQGGWGAGEVCLGGAG